MKLKMAKQRVFEKIYQAVKKIPLGKVTTYGFISKYLAIKNPRIIGWALHANKNPQVPCHRVVSKEGRLAENYAFGGWQKQKERLKKEGVTFKGKREVNLEKHLLGK